MLDPWKYSDPIVRVYEQLVDELLVDMAKRFNIRATGNTGTFSYDVELLAQLGAVRRDSAAIIARHIAKNEPMIELAIEQAMLDALEGVEPELAEAARRGLLEGESIPMREGMAARLEAYSRQAVSQLNLVNTVMLDGTMEAYRNGVYKLKDIVQKLDRAQEILNVETGKALMSVSTYKEAVRGAVASMADAGITGYVDHGGHKWTAEAYVRMDIHTTCSNASNQAVFDRNEQYGNDLIWVRTNRTARPGCAPWQGKVIAMNGQGRTVVDQNGREIYAYGVEETTYGQPAGIFGINCHHGPPNPFIPGASLVRGQGTGDEEANAERYAMSQQQRQMERSIREAKREAAMLNAAGDDEGYQDARQKVRQRQKKLNAFTTENDLIRDYDREWVFGYK